MSGAGSGAMWGRDSDLSMSMVEVERFYLAAVLSTY